MPNRRGFIWGSFLSRCDQGPWYDNSGVEHLNYSRDKVLQFLRFTELGPGFVGRSLWLNTLISSRNGKRGNHLSLNMTDPWRPQLFPRTTVASLLMEELDFQGKFSFQELRNDRWDPGISGKNNMEKQQRLVWMVKTHVKTPKNPMVWIVQPLRFPVKNSYFRSPRPGTISLLKRQQLGDEICYFWMEKGVVYHWMEQGTKKNQTKTHVFDLIG